MELHRQRMSAKHCGHHDEDRRKLYRWIFAGILAFIILVLIAIFLIWVILKPTKPRFILQDATVYVFNLSSTQPSITSPIPNTLSTTIQATVSSRNPNDKVGIYYQKLDIYATYRSQQITYPTSLPSSYQGHKEITVWSPNLYGNAVPVSPYVLNSLLQDQNAGAVLVNIKINGRVKWKVGTWTSGKYHIFVNCPAYIRLAGDKNSGFGLVGPAVKFQLLQSCSVDV
ncbi:Late embryogenesis abundant protein [Quillaja saponaria]|uniref:Late embryogenesis abundant protein n=1 Tax=Quillaja saponaria TaxID=32244 RepID=A0AAD7QGT2_QUISA|nr:Late embryogenesis abundant protein [Quillaja saponaria]